MARIGKPLEASDHELAPGVFFRLKPADSLILLSAEAKARAEISEILSGGARMAEWGFEVNGEPVATDDEWLSLLAGLSVFISACFLAELMLEGWSGIEDDDGQPAEVSLANIRQVFRYGLDGEPMALLGPFLEISQRAKVQRAAEKNV